MVRSLQVFIPALALAASAASPALAQGEIGTIARGAYACEMPGDVRGAAGVPQPDQSFTIENASRYNAPQGGGTYLRRGDTVTFTTGARSGEAYRIVGRDFLRKLEGGEPGRLRCVRQG